MPRTASEAAPVLRRRRPFVFASATLLLVIVLVVELNLHFDAVDAGRSDLWLLVLMVVTGVALLIAAVATIHSLWRAVTR